MASGSDFMVRALAGALLWIPVGVSVHAQVSPENRTLVSLTPAEEVRAYRSEIFERDRVLRIGERPPMPESLRAAQQAWFAKQQQRLLVESGKTKLPRYHVVSLGTLGGRETFAADINDKGQVTGTSETSDEEFHAFIYSNGQMTDLGTLGGSESRGADINNAGDIAGTSDSRAFTYSKGRMIDLGGSAAYSSGDAINSRGSVVGHAHVAGTCCTYRAFQYTPGDGIQDLGTIGNESSQARAISDNGVVVGIYYERTTYDIPHAFLYSNGRMIDLAPGRSSNVADGRKLINAQGHIAGSMEFNGATHAFLYKDGVAYDIGDLGGGYSSASEINDHDQIAGSALSSHGVGRAFLYSDGLMEDLGTLGWAITDYGSSAAYSLNNRGEVTGSSLDENGDRYAFVYFKGEMIGLGSLDGFESSGDRINERGQVIGTYYVPWDANYPPYVRSFIATPIPVLYWSLRTKTDRAVGGTHLIQKLTTSLRSYRSEDADGACRPLQNYLTAVRAASGERLRWKVARELITDAKTLRGALGCN